MGPGPLWIPRLRFACLVTLTEQPLHRRARYMALACEMRKATQTLREPLCTLIVARTTASLHARPRRERTEMGQHDDHRPIARARTRDHNIDDAGLIKGGEERRSDHGERERRVEAIKRLGSLGDHRGANARERGTGQ